MTAEYRSVTGELPRLLIIIFFAGLGWTNSLTLVPPMKRRSGVLITSDSQTHQFLKLEPRGPNYRQWFSVNETKPLRKCRICGFNLWWLYLGLEWCMLPQR